MNKIIKIISFTVILISILSVVSYAHSSSNSSFTFYYYDREITIESTGICEEEARSIADFIVYGITPIGSIDSDAMINTPLICILFGHDIETYSARETIHNVYPTSPKCVINTYHIERCSRASCDYIEKTLITSIPTSACHG